MEPDQETKLIIWSQGGGQEGWGNPITSRKIVKYYLFGGGGPLKKRKIVKHDMLGVILPQAQS